MQALTVDDGERVSVSVVFLASSGGLCAIGTPSVLVLAVDSK